MRFSLTDKKPSIFDSKVGGLPYLPESTAIPTNKNGEQLRLIAQINCKDMLPLEGFPHSGIIQFWTASDECWGLYNDYGYKVLYHKTIDSSLSESGIAERISEMSDYEKECFPLKGEYSLEFRLDSDTLPFSTADFIRYYNKLFPESPITDWIHELLGNETYEKYSSHDGKYCTPYGHKVGGYSEYCQGEPRNEEEKKKYDFQLLQLDSDFGRDLTRIMYGDAGICHFFINSEKLKACDFSDIFYYCDCC